MVCVSAFSFFSRFVVVIIIDWLLLLWLDSNFLDRIFGFQIVSISEPTPNSTIKSNKIHPIVVNTPTQTDLDFFFFFCSVCLLLLIKEREQNGTSTKKEVCAQWQSRKKNKCVCDCVWSVCLTSIQQIYGVANFQTSPSHSPNSSHTYTIHI